MIKKTKSLTFKISTVIMLLGFLVGGATILNAERPLSEVLSLENGRDKSTICHSTNSEKNVWNVIEINSDTLESHTEHGDFLYEGPLKENGKPDNTDDADLTWCIDNAPEVLGEEDENPITSELIAVATISAHKVVCPSEELLPNWSGGADITETTAADFIAEHEECSLEDWVFEWAPEGTATPDNNDESGGTGWTVFQSEATIPAGSSVYVREQTEEGYVPFSGDGDVSAEIYCHTDVLNYDNLEIISDLEEGETYHCVAFNAREGAMCEEETETLTFYSDDTTLINDEASAEMSAHPGWSASIPGATWIWDESPIVDSSPDKTVTFTKTFSISGTPTDGELMIAADNTYSVSINGEDLCESEDSNNYSSDTQDVCEIDASLLSSGTNTLVIDVTNQGSGNTATNPGGLLYKLTIDKNSCEGEVRDICPNIDGIQEEVPEGMELEDGVCIDPDEGAVCEPGINLIDNGGFEEPDIPTGTYSIVPESHSLLGWAVDWISAEISGTLGLELQDNIAGSPTEGSQFAELDGDHPVKISQEIETIPGETYTIEFKFSPRPGTPASDNNIVVKADGVTLGAPIIGDGSSLSNTSWTEISRTFTATDSSTTIEFADMGSDNALGSYVDDVVMTCDDGSQEPSELICEEDQDGREVGVIYSDTTTLEGGDATVIVPEPHHVNWTALIDGASWIWGEHPVADHVNETNETFTKTFNLTEEVAEGTLYITSDNSYTVELNGEELCADSEETNYFSVDECLIEGDAFVVGANTLEFHVKNWAQAGGTQESNPAGLMYKLVIPGGGCETPELPEDMCTNIDGIQETIPPLHQAGPNGTCVGIVAGICDGETKVSYYYSDAETSVDGRDSVAVPPPHHENWTASIPGAIWIWSEHPVADPVNGGTETFGREFFIEGTPAGGEVMIASDNLYSVSVNGNLVCSEQSNLYNFTAETQDTCVIDASDLVAGTNTITFAVTNQVFPNGTQELNPAGLMYKLTVRETGNDECQALPVPECSDNRDNADPEDSLADEEDPGCWTDLNNSGTYNPNDNDETNAPGQCVDDTSSQVIYSDTTTTINGSASVAATDIPDWNDEIPGATWIWEEDPVSTDNPVDNEVVFSKSFNVEGTATGGELIIAADNSYEVFLNGDALCADASEDNFSTNQKDTCVISADMLQSGSNTITFEVTNKGSSGPANPAGLLYKLTINENSCEDVPDTSELPDDNNNSNDNDDDDSSGGGGGARILSSGSGGSRLGQGEVLGAQSFCGLYIDRYLRKGYVRNNPAAVTLLQEFLNEEMDAGLTASGVFDDATEVAVKNFQAKYKLDVLDPWGPTVAQSTIPPTGIFYLTTLRMANMLKCPDLDLAMPELINWSYNPTL